MESVEKLIAILIITITSKSITKVIKILIAMLVEILIIVTMLAITLRAIA